MNGKQLKNSILQWAIQGKLVPQDPNDEPASELLKRIREEKARLVKEGKIKKDKNESIIFRGDDNSHYEKLANGEVRCIDGELPFEIPCNWEWCRLGSVIHLLSGRDLEPNQYSNIPSGIPYMTGASNFENGELIINRWTNNPVTISSKGDLLITCKGTIGTMAFNNIGDIHIARQIMSISSIKHEIKFIQFFLDWYVSILQKKAKSIIPGISRENLLEAIVPTPPLKEQRRIVSKLEELLLHIDKYDAAQTQLDRLNDELYGLLKKSILQEAIHGKLVPQCDTDEPASKLLERIKDEKQKLVKAGKLKAKDIVDSVIFKGEDNKYYEQIGNNCIEISDEIPFSIPEKWKWCRLKQVCSISMGQSPDGESVNGTTGVEFHQGKIQFGEIYLNDSDTYTNKPTKIAEANSLLLCVRAPVGILNITKRQICIGRGLCSINPYYNSNILLWFYFLSTYRDYFEKKATGSTFKAISNEIISNTLIPLPPMGEQQRIVERIQELYSKL